MKMPDFGKNNIVVYLLLVVMIASGIFVPVLLDSSMSNRVKYYSSKFKAGELADEDVFADRAFIFTDQTKTDALRASAAAEVLPVFSILRNETLSNLNRRRSFSEALRVGNFDKAFAYLNPGTELSPSTRQALSAMGYRNINRILSVLEEIHTNLLNRGLYDAAELVEQASAKGYAHLMFKSDLTANGSVAYTEVAVDDCLTYHSMLAHCLEIINTYNVEMEPSDVMILAELIPALIVPNVHYNAVETAEKKLEAENRVDTVVILVSKGDMLITRDSVISETDVAIVNSMAQSTMHLDIPHQAANCFILTLVSLVCFIFMDMSVADEKHRRVEYLLIPIISVIVSMAAVFLLYPTILSVDSSSYDFFLPVFFAPLFVLFATGRKTLGALTAFILAVYTRFLPYAVNTTMLFILLVNLSCVLIVKFVTGRLDMMFQWLSMVGIGVLYVIAKTAIEAEGFGSLLQDCVVFILNISLDYVLVLLLLPVFEKLLNLPTYFRLKELAYTESPMLTKLSATCPGTYSHVKAVAELAEKAAVAIGANALLTRVGALYHDIGKIDHPEYFTENQTEGNKHDAIKPSLSVAIIKSHVRLGVEKGKEIGLPPEVIDLIGEHHGNDVIRYFYNEASKDDENVSKADYSYSGTNTPSTKESGILMLADSVEAASRSSLKSNSSAAIEKFVGKIVMQKFENNQLDKCPVTLKELDIISRSFVGTIIGQAHSRIEYPDEEKTNAAKKK